MFKYCSLCLSVNTAVKPNSPHYSTNMKTVLKLGFRCEVKENQSLHCLSSSVPVACSNHTKSIKQGVKSCICFLPISNFTLRKHKLLSGVVSAHTVALLIRELALMFCF